MEDNNLTDKQKRVLEAAVEVFSEKGYSAASTSEIAKKAGVAEGTIFRHYRTKKGLLFSIITPAVVKLGAPLLLKEFEKVLEMPYGSFGDFLRAVIKNRIEFAKKNPAVLKILANEVSYHSEIQDMLKEIFVTRVFPKIESVIEYFQKKGEIKKLPVNTITRLIISTAVGYVVKRVLIAPDEQWDDEKEIEIMVDFLINGLRAD